MLVFKELLVSFKNPKKKQQRITTGHRYAAKCDKRNFGSLNLTWVFCFYFSIIFLKTYITRNLHYIKKLHKVY